MKKQSVRSLKRRRDVAGLATIARRPLPDESSDRVVGALDALVKVGTSEAQATLLDLLDNGPDWNRGMTAWALRNARDRLTLEALIRTATSRGSAAGASPRGQAMSSLAFRGGPEADATLIQLLEDPDPHVRMHVASMLAFREPPAPEAVRTLADLLNGADPEVRRLAGSLLDELPHAQPSKALRTADAAAAPRALDSPSEDRSPGTPTTPVEDLGLTGLARLIRERDVDGLARVFSLAADWDTRETVMVGFKELYRAGGSDPAVRDRLRSVLPQLLALCKAESKGGSYRVNCISAAESLLAQLDEHER